MNGFTYLININVGGMGAIGKLLSMVDSLENRLGKVESNVSHFGQSLEQAGRRGQAAFGGMGSSLNGLIARIGVAALTMGSINQAVDTNSIERAIRFSGGPQGAENLAFVRQSADELKMPLDAALEGFKTLSGGMMGTKVTMEQQRDLFTAIGQASTVMGLSTDETKGSILALAQMASKGTVSAEELRGQLGERLPGAFNIAARAMGVSTAQLGKMMEQGQVVSEVFLPKFAAELHKTFGPGMAEALNSPRALMNEMGNSITMLKNEIGVGLLPVATQLIKDFLIPGATWFRENRDAVFDVAKAFGVLYVATKTLVAANLLQDAITKGLTFSVWGLNAAMLANPVTWVVAGLLALGAAVYYAWNHFETFRAGVLGTWEVLKNLYHTTVEPFVSFIANYWIVQMKVLVWVFGKLWEGLVWVDQKIQPLRDSFWALMDTVKSLGLWVWEHLIKPFTMVGKLFTMLAPVFQKAGVSLGDSFTEGWNRGMADFAGTANSTVLPVAQALTRYSEAVPDLFGQFGSAAPISSPDSGAPKGPFAPPVTPGSAPGSQKAAKVAEGITGGGQRNVTVNLGALISSLTLHAQNVTEGTDEVVELLTRKLLQVLNSANQVQTSN
jgi:tape measure domain-containing protein